MYTYIDHLLIMKKEAAIIINVEEKDPLDVTDEIVYGTVQIEDKHLTNQMSLLDDHDNAIEVENPIVQKAYDKLAQVFSKNYEKALMEAGQYIVRTFYGDEENIEDSPYDEEFEFSKQTIENARLKKSPKKDTLNQLYQKIDKNCSSNMPSKAWIYNSVNLIVQWHDIKTELPNSFHTYRNLFLSHKICLLRLQDIEKKDEFITIIKRDELSVRELTELISKIKKITNKEKSLYSVINNPDELFSDKYSEKLELTALNNISIDKLKLIESKMLQECREYEASRLTYYNKSSICDSYVVKYSKS